MRERFKRRFQIIKTWFFRHKKITVPASIVLLILASWLLVWLVKGSGPVERIDSSADTEEPELPAIVPSPLTGLDISAEIAELPVIGVMIENSTLARPQSGLGEAGIVFEAIAEGGITRFLALYLEDQPKNIGPIRSLRPYYLDWVLTFDAAISHVGGSPEAIARAKSELASRDLDQFRYGSRAYERVGFRRAPHNVYTNMQKLRQIAKDAKIEDSKFTPLSRKEAAPVETPNAANITVNYSSAAFQAGWTYNQSRNNYARRSGGVALKDRDTTKDVRADVVVVIKTSYRTSDSSGRQVVATVGSGEAYVFQDGTVKRGSWTKTSNKSQFVFKDQEGEEIKLNPGRTWFHVVPTNQNVTYR